MDAYDALDILGAVLIAIFISFRLVPWLRLRSLVSQLRPIVLEVNELIREHGPTVGDLTKAGVYDKLQQSEKTAGEIYKRAIATTAYLLAGKRLRPYYARVIEKAVIGAGYGRKGMMGVKYICDDLLTGSITLKDYFPATMLKGMLGALDSIKLFIFF